MNRFGYDSCVGQFGNLSDGLIYNKKMYMRFFDLKTHDITAQRVFDYSVDPRETKSLREDFGKVNDIILHAAGSHGLEYPSKYDQLDPEVIGNLRSLGYLQ